MNHTATHTAFVLAPSADAPSAGMPEGLPS